MATIDEAVTAVVASLPQHGSGLHLSHNEHLTVYESVNEFTATFGDDVWVSHDERVKALATNELWLLQWYPDTPVGHYMRAASSLAALLA